MSDCGVWDPSVESQQLCVHCGPPVWDTALCTPNAVPRLTQPSALCWTVKWMSVMMAVVADSSGLADAQPKSVGWSQSWKPPRVIIIKIIIIFKTAFLSSRRSHYKSSHGSFDECRKVSVSWILLLLLLLLLLLFCFYLGSKDHITRLKGQKGLKSELSCSTKESRNSTELKHWVVSAMCWKLLLLLLLLLMVAGVCRTWGRLNTQWEHLATDNWYVHLLCATVSYSCAGFCRVFFAYKTVGM